MSDSVTGLYIGYEYITLARWLSNEKIVENITIQNLDTTLPYAKAVAEGFDELREHNALIKGEQVVLSFASKTSELFITDVDSLVEDTHEMLSWELMMRANAPLNKYSFSTAKLHDNRYVGYAVMQKEIKEYEKMLKKAKVKTVAIDSDIFAIVNLFEQMEGRGKSGVLLILDSGRTAIVAVEAGVISTIKFLSAVDETIDASDISSKLSSSIEELSNDYSIAIDGGIFVFGELLTDMQLRESLVSGIKNSKIMNLFNKISEKTGIDSDSLERYAPLVSVAVGLSQKVIG
jgi:hypothetical protein